MINNAGLAEIVWTCEDKSLIKEDAEHSKINADIMYNRIKDTNSSSWSICKLAEALDEGYSNTNSGKELEETVGIITEKFAKEGEEIDPVTEFVHAYTYYSSHVNSRHELEIAAGDTFDKLLTLKISGEKWGDISDTIKLMAKYSAKSNKGKSVLEMKNVICDTLDYVHQNGLNINSINGKIDAAYMVVVRDAKNKYDHKKEEIKMNNTGSIRIIKLLKERINFELYQHNPSVSAQELCDKIVNDKNYKYN